MKYLLTVLILISISSSQIFAQFYTDFTAEDIDGNEIKLSSFVDKGPVMLGFLAVVVFFLQRRAEKYANLI